jgi:hypothetical protein
LGRKYEKAIQLNGSDRSIFDEIVVKFESTSSAQTNLSILPLLPRKKHLQSSPNGDSSKIEDPEDLALDNPQEKLGINYTDYSSLYLNENIAIFKSKRLWTKIKVPELSSKASSDEAVKFEIYLENILGRSKETLNEIHNMLEEEPAATFQT